MPDGSIDERPDVIGSDYALYEHNKVSSDAKYIVEKNKELHPNSNFEIKPDATGRFKMPTQIINGAAEVRACDALQNYYRELSEMSLSSENEINDNLPKIQKCIDEANFVCGFMGDHPKHFSKQQIGYAKKLNDEIHEAMSNSYLVEDSPWGAFPYQQQLNKQTYDLIMKDLGILQKYSEKLKGKQIDIYLDKLKEKKAQIRQQHAVKKQKAIRSVLPKYFEQMLQKEGIHPMHETDYVQTHPYIFTTEGLRPNVSKSIETSIKKGDEKDAKNRFGKLAHKQYQHYIISAPEHTKVVDFDYFEDVKKGHKDSSHVGRRDKKSSHKIR